MGQPVKLSEELVLEARLTGEAMQRSIAGQLEFWVRLGKAVEGLLTGQQMMALGRSGKSESTLNRLDAVDTPEGRRRVKDYLASEPFPRYFAHPRHKKLLIREEEDGRHTTGRFVNREFVAVRAAKKNVRA